MAQAASRKPLVTSWSASDTTENTFTAQPVDPRLALPLLISQVLSAGRHARLLCDQKLSVLWTNPQCEELLESTSALRVDRGRIVVNKRAQHARLETFVSAPAGEDLVLFSGDEDEPERFAVHVLRVRCVLNSWCFALKIIDQAEDAGDSFRHFDEYYQMTTKETDICRDLLTGETVAVIAKRRNCSPDTVRFHIQNLYRKLDVSSREEMFARLRAFQMD